MDRRFRWLWAAYAVSTFGTWLGFGAFALIAVLVLRAGPSEVALLAATGPAAGVLVAVLLGPSIEARQKRPVMVTADLVRCAALASVPAAYTLGWLTLPHLVAVSIVTAAADIAFKAASGAFLRSLVPRDALLAASGRLEATTWAATLAGPPLGTAAIGLLGPVVTVAADAVSYLLSALGLRAVRSAEEVVQRHPAGSLGEGWRYILRHRDLRLLFANTVAVNGLIMATSPLLAVLLLGRLGFAPWQYGLAFGAPCLGGLLGSRLAPRLVARFGRGRVLRTAGVLRACWSLGLAFPGPGAGGLVLVLAVQFALVTCMGVFNPVFATERLERIAPDRIARTLTAWSVSSSAAIAALTLLWGRLADVAGLRTAIAAAGMILLATPLFLVKLRAGES
nr:MFS transporter [Actinoplanes lichenis]